MRRLIWVPMVHTQDELDFEVLSGHEVEAQKLWEKIKAEIKKLNFDPKRVKIFVDGVTKGEEKRILMEKGPTAEISRSFVTLGAMVMATESPDLLADSDEIRTKALIAEDFMTEDKEDFTYYDDSISILTELKENTRLRDIFMAGQIDLNLHEDEVGFLFVGGAHRVQEYLSPDIKVEPLSQEFLDLFRKYESEYGFEKTLEGLKTTRDSFIPRYRGAERQ